MTVEDRLQRIEEMLGRLLGIVDRLLPLVERFERKEGAKAAVFGRKR